MKKRRPGVVVVGGGFGGLNVVRGLRGVDADVVLVDRQNHHLFQPLLYQVASAVLSPAEIAQPIRRILRNQENARVVLGEVDQIDLDHRRVRFDQIDLGYDYLVLAAGVTHSYFGKDHWAARAPGLKSIDDALEIRRRILLAFEAAEIESDAAARRSTLTFVIVGGGPTGVELAGAVKEIAVDTLRRDFRNVDTGSARVILVEGQDRLLPSMSATASKRALRDLESMGIEVRLSSFVTEIDREAVFVGDDRIEAGNVFWAAGVKASPLSSLLGTELDKAGRVVVSPDCSVPGHPNVFVIGDMAHLTDPDTGAPIPGVAQGALQMGTFVATILRRELESGRPSERGVFRYRDKGSMATIGRARAVADMGKTSLGGWVAWLAWGIIHILFLIGFKNRVFVMISWAWNYLVAAKGARLITGPASLDVKRPAVVLSRRSGFAELPERSEVAPSDNVPAS